MNLASLSGSPQNGQSSCFSTFCNLPFSTVLSFAPVVIQSYHMNCSDWWWGTYTKDMEGASNSDHKEGKKDKTIHQPIKQTWHKKQTLAFGSEEDWVLCMVHNKQSNINKNVSRMPHGVVRYSLICGLSHQTAFMRTSWH